jgi:hypothetical protein
MPSVRLTNGQPISDWNIFPTIQLPVATERDETNVMAKQGSISLAVVIATYCYSLQAFRRKLRCIETFASSFVPHFRRFTILNTSAN